MLKLVADDVPSIEEFMRRYRVRSVVPIRVYPAYFVITHWIGITDGRPSGPPSHHSRRPRHCARLYRVPAVVFGEFAGE